MRPTGCDFGAGSSSLDGEGERKRTRETRRGRRIEPGTGLPHVSPENQFRLLVERSGAVPRASPFPSFVRGRSLPLPSPPLPRLSLPLSRSPRWWPARMAASISTVSTQIALSITVAQFASFATPAITVPFPSVYGQTQVSHTRPLPSLSLRADLSSLSASLSLPPASVVPCLPPDPLHLRRNRNLRRNPHPDHHRRNRRNGGNLHRRRRERHHLRPVGLNRVQQELVANLGNRGHRRAGGSSSDRPRRRHLLPLHSRV